VVLKKKKIYIVFMHPNSGYHRDGNKKVNTFYNSSTCRLENIFNFFLIL